MTSAETNDWATEAHARAYLERSTRMPKRDVGYEELLELLALRPPPARVLDLGTGDGRLLAMIGAPGVALDFSPTMLAAARERFAGRSDVEVVEHNLNAPLPDLGGFDLVVSSFAIHHCPDERKRALYAEVFAILEPGGVFANLEHVASPSARLHRAFMDAMGQTEDDPANQLLDLDVQLGWLRDLGFTDVDCLWKWRELALLTAVKPG